MEALTARGRRGSRQSRPAGIGVVLTDSDGRVVKEVAEPLGITTNNVAEYTALIRSLEEALAVGCNSISVITDSELMARQINGQYAVKAEHLKPLSPGNRAPERVSAGDCEAYAPREQS